MLLRGLELLRDVLELLFFSRERLGALLDGRRDLELLAAPRVDLVLQRADLVLELVVLLSDRLQRRLAAPPVAVRLDFLLLLVELAADLLLELLDRLAPARGGDRSRTARRVKRRRNVDGRAPALDDDDGAASLDGRRLRGRRRTRLDEDATERSSVDERRPNGVARPRRRGGAECIFRRYFPQETPAARMRSVLRST